MSEKKLTTKEVNNIQSFRKNIMNFEKQLLSLSTSYGDGKTPGGEEVTKVNPLNHRFVDGMYVREIFTPKGQVFTTAIHKKDHMYFFMQGELSILSEDGIKRLKAPYYGVTTAGTKRVVYVHEDTIWVTIHETKAKTVDEVIEDVIAKDFNDPKISIENMRKHLKIKKL
tara:strand:+ start:114 stop:620 length:507 start_codon:yes stop_codon:yes gene_type:complete